MAFTQPDLDAVRERIKNARKRVDNGDQGITEFNVSELIALEAHISRALTAANVTASRSNVSYARFRRTSGW